jgi:beta-lactamase regulating signal transducer with metallopeptidase domain
VEEKAMLDPRPLYYLGVHLLYASIVWLAAWVLTSIPRGSATTKYWIWFATSLNFILPAGAVLDKLLARHLSWARPLSIIGDAGLSIAENTPVALSLFVVWLVGAALMFTRLCRRIRAERRDARAMSGQGVHDQRPGFLAHGVPVKYAGSGQGPAVDGVLHPHISLPEGIDRLLSEHELNAVLIHESRHAKRRDNLIRLVHELGVCALWFHPLVWITSSRISLYRELSCDESVLESAHGGDLISALAKLANPQEALLLQATASSFLSHRLARLAEARPPQTSRAASALLTAAFGAVLVAGVFETMAHTACCFLIRK